MNALDKRFLRIASASRWRQIKIAHDGESAVDRKLARLCLILDWEGQKREANGRFGSGKKPGTGKASEKAGKEKSPSKSKTNLQLFAGRDLSKQSSSSLRKGIKSHKKEITLHREKVSHPEQYDKEWNSYSEIRKASVRKHWEHEIKVFKQNIVDSEEELKKRGEEP